ncbi:MAG TPA: hypothetical protein VF791_04200 [Pyrinomonadaceae bacterium]
MTLQRRVKKLETENGINNDGLCECVYPNAIDVRMYLTDSSTEDADADTRPADDCTICGGKRRIIKVVYVENGRGAEAA